MTSTPKLLYYSSIVMCLIAGINRAGAAEYISNLSIRFVDPANPDVGNENEIGDDQWLFSGYQPFAVQFFTGAGSDEQDFAKTRIDILHIVATNLSMAEHFELNSATFEFLGGHSQAWSNVSVQLYHQVGKENILIGELGNPVVNPALTQWPESIKPDFCTTYVDYHALREVILEPSSAYWLSLSVASDNPPWFTLLFGLTPNFVTSTDWRMGVTTTHDPWVVGEHLKFAVNATAIQGTNSTSSLGTNSPGVAVSNVRLSAARVGSNVVLSWPASTAPSQLCSSPSFESGVWSPVSTQPVSINGQFVVTIPVSASGSYFRLQAQ